jgi:hypothetical protein
MSDKTQNDETPKDELTIKKVTIREISPEALDDVRGGFDDGLVEYGGGSWRSCGGSAPC